MNEEIAEYYEELYNLCAVEQEQPLARRYRQLREALERVMRQQMMGTGKTQDFQPDRICKRTGQAGRLKRTARWRQK